MSLQQEKRHKIRKDETTSLEQIYWVLVIQETRAHYHMIQTHFSKCHSLVYNLSSSWQTMVIQSWEHVDRTMVERTQDVKRGHYWASYTQQAYTTSLQALIHTTTETITELYNETLSAIVSLIHKGRVHGVHLMRRQIYMQLEGNVRNRIVMKSALARSLLSQRLGFQHVR